MTSPKQELEFCIAITHSEPQSRILSAFTLSRVPWELLALPPQDGSARPALSSFDVMCDFGWFSRRAPRGGIEKA